MDSPKRKQQKRNDYLRHKMFRKIRKRQKAELEQQKKAAEKELKRRLRVTPIRKFEGGKDAEYDAGVLDNVIITGNRKPANIMFDKNTGNYYRESTGDVVTPVNKLVEDDPSTWSFTDKNGTIFTPHGPIFNNNPGEINQAEDSSAAKKALDAALQYSNEHYNNPILGAAARWNESWRNDKNPVKAVWNSPFGYAFPITRFGHAFESDFGIPDFKTAYDLAKQHDPRSLVYTFQGLGNAAMGAEGTSRLANTFATVLPKRSITPQIGATNPQSLEITGKSPLQLTGPQQQKLLGYDYIVPEEQFSRQNPHHKFTGRVIRDGDGKFQANVGYLVNEDGSVNTNAAKQILRQLKSDTGFALDLRNGQRVHHRTPDGIQNLGPFDDPASFGVQRSLRHLWEAAKTAQSQPVAKGSTAQQQVLQALMHDVGEIDNSKYGHESESANIANDIFYDLPNQVYENILNHGRNDILYTGSPSLKALRFSDAFAGSKYDDIIKYGPDYGYAKEQPITNTGRDYSNIPMRDVYKNYINPVLKVYGIDPVDLNASSEIQKHQLLDKILEFRTFTRGLGDPIHFIPSREDAIDFDKNVVDYFGGDYDSMPEIFGQLKSTPEQRMIYSATHFYGPRDGGGGRSGLQRVMRRHRIPDSVPVGTLYTSNSYKVADGYANKYRPYSSVVDVRLPMRGSEEDHPIDLWIKNSFPLYDADNLSKNPTGEQFSEWYMYDEPYRLATGRSLIQDIKKDERVTKEIQQIKEQVFNDLQSTLKNSLKVASNPDTDYYYPAFVQKLNDTVKSYNKNTKFSFPEQPSTYAQFRAVQDTYHMLQRLDGELSIGMMSALQSESLTSAGVFKDAQEAAWVRNNAHKIMKEYEQGIQSGKYSEKEPPLDVRRLDEVIRRAHRKIIDYYLVRLNSYKQQIAIDMQKKVNTIYRKYKEEYLKQNRVHPAYETDEVQSSPFVFTTESTKRKNQSKSGMTKAKRLNKNTSAGYQHYIVVGQPEEEGLDFVTIRKSDKHVRPSSRHSGPRSEGLSKKVQ